MLNEHEKRIEAELGQLQKDICRVGSNPGHPSVRFGELFDDEEVEQYYEALVGTLKCAKKRGIISFKGHMLLKGMHDDVMICIVDEENQKETNEVPVTRRFPVTSSTTSPSTTYPVGTPTKRHLNRSLSDERNVDIGECSSGRKSCFSGRTSPKENVVTTPVRTPPRVSSKWRVRSIRVETDSPDSWSASRRAAGAGARRYYTPQKEGAPTCRQTPPRPPPSSSLPVRDLPALPSLQNSPGSPSPLRHTRRDHMSLKIPEIFGGETIRSDYASDTEVTTRRSRHTSAASVYSAASDTEAEVTFQQQSLRNGKSPFPIPAEGDPVISALITPRRTKGSVSERWSKRIQKSRSKVEEEKKFTGNVSRPNSTKKLSDSRARRHTISTTGEALNNSEISPAPRGEVAKEINAARTNNSKHRQSLPTPGNKTKLKSRPPALRAQSARPLVQSASARVQDEVELLLKDICRVGSNPGEPSVKFGELFDDEDVQNTYEALVGTLRSAKRKGLIRFKGQMLFKGMHDNVLIEIVPTE